jgi:RNA-directed DNA polymerase
VQFHGRRAADKETKKVVSPEASQENGIQEEMQEESQAFGASEQEQPLKASYLMEQICSHDNMHAAYKQVYANKGAPGIDGMTVWMLKSWLEEHRHTLIEQLMQGTYKPKPVRKVEIPKPQGGTRMLGIPTVVDRFVQQAIAQVLTPIFDPGFSNSSYGFRPRRDAHQALKKAQEYVQSGKVFVVDIDLEKFFDRVHHDVLMVRVARKVGDKRVLQLIGKFLRTGIMDEGLYEVRTEGVPQGSPLSPLLSNIMLDDLDKELERRGHSFCRYADDCNIYVGSQKAGERVMETITEFLEKKLRLRVNRDKSAVAPSSKASISWIHPIL